MQRRAAVDNQGALRGFDQSAVARVGCFVVSAIQRDVFKPESSIGSVELKQLLLTRRAGDGADGACRAAIGVFGIRHGRGGQGDVCVGEVGDRGCLSDGIVLDQHLDVDRIAAGNECEFVQRLGQSLVDRVPAVGAREGVAVRVRDLADIITPVDFGIVR